MSARASSPRARSSWLPYILTVLVVAGSLVGRIIVRGPYYPGWDTLYPAEGLFLVSTQPAKDAVMRSLTGIGPGRGGNALSAPLDSVAYALLPGYLTRLWPWEYWAHTVSFLLVFASVLFTIKAAGLPLRQGWIVLLAWGASPPLLSFALAGQAYASGYFPHALALWVTLDRRFERRLLLTLLLSLFACAFSWYLYDTARTVFAVFLGAAVLRWDARWPARALWLAVGGLQLWAAAKWPGMGAGFMPSLWQIPKLTSALVSIGKDLFVTRYLDIPVLFIAGLLSFLFFRRDRLLVLGLLLAQIALLVLLATRGADMLRPRRFLMVESYCMLAVGRMYAETWLGTAPRSHQALAVPLVLMLVAGNVWQVAGLVQFARAPLLESGWALPYTHSQADYRTPRHGPEWAHEIASRAEAGEKLIVIYTLGAYGENATDPTGVLERMYLRLGHERFVDSVFVFGQYSCHPNCLPIRPLSAVADTLDKIRPDGPILPEDVGVYYTQDLFRSYWHVAEPESAEIFGAVRRRFSLILDSSPDADLMRFRITPRPADANAGFRFEPEVGTYERLSIGPREERPFVWSGPPFEQYWVVDEPPRAPFLLQRPWAEEPFAVRLPGRLHVSRGGTFELFLGSDEDARVTIGGRVVVTNPAVGRFRVAQSTVRLRPGSYPMALDYTDRDGTAHLIFDVYRSTDQTADHTLAAPAPSP